jgi:hypothetical protein
MSSPVVVDRDFNTKTLDKGLKNVEVGIKFGFCRSQKRKKIMSDVQSQDLHFQSHVSWSFLCLII